MILRSKRFRFICASALVVVACAGCYWLGRSVRKQPTQGIRRIQLEASQYRCIACFVYGAADNANLQKLYLIEEERGKKRFFLLTQAVYFPNDFVSPATAMLLPDPLVFDTVLYNIVTAPSAWKAWCEKWREYGAKQGPTWPFAAPESLGLGM